MILYFSDRQQRLDRKETRALLGRKRFHKRVPQTEETFADTECRRVVFVVPTYAWRIPRIVEQWILRSSLRRGQRYTSL